MADNQHSFVSIIQRITDSLGFDLIPYAIGLLKFKANAPFQPTKLNEIEKQLDGLTGKNIEDALSYSKEMLDAENERGNTLDNKANNLISVTGISTAFATGVASLIFDKSLPLLLWLILFLYIFIVLSLTLTVLIASRVVKVGEYMYAYPEISDVFAMGSQTLNKTKKDRLASYLYCYAKNYQINNIKASYLIGSQKWFRNAIVLFLILAFTLALSIPHNLNSAVNSSTSLPTITLTIAPKIFTATTRPTAIVTSTTDPMFTSTPTFESTTHQTIPNIYSLPSIIPLASTSSTTPNTP
jgi:hypothetical protein